MSQNYFTEGFRFLHEGRYPEAIAAFQEVVKEQPESAEAHYNLGNAYIGLRDYPAALKAYHEAIRLNPAFVQAHTNLGFTYARLGRH
ncbi:MAG: tetratricopeptide repeat protein, partial [Deltaproteobacteria bacterium]|nr:tetratricopeptide repeat protein [Deltaproteobacteria bacterium]